MARKNLVIVVKTAVRLFESEFGKGSQPMRTGYCAFGPVQVVMTTSCTSWTGRWAFMLSSTQTQISGSFSLCFVRSRHDIAIWAHP